MSASGLGISQEHCKTKEIKAKKVAAVIALVSYDAERNGFSKEAAPKDLGPNAGAPAEVAQAAAPEELELACAPTDNGERLSATHRILEEFGNRFQQ
jgi:hypothetical protein